MNGIQTKSGRSTSIVRRMMEREGRDYRHFRYDLHQNEYDERREDTGRSISIGASLFSHLLEEMAHIIQTIN
jgi:hypothetical protein